MYNAVLHVAPRSLGSRRDSERTHRLGQDLAPPQHVEHLQHAELEQSWSMQTGAAAGATYSAGRRGYGPAMPRMVSVISGCEWPSTADICPEVKSRIERPSAAKWTTDAPPLPTSFAARKQPAERIVV